MWLFLRSIRSYIPPGNFFYASQRPLANFSSTPRNSLTRLSSSCARRTSFFWQTESGLDQSRSRMPALASSRVGQSVVMGSNLWHPDEHSVDFGDVSPGNERAFGYQTRRCAKFRSGSIVPPASLPPASSAFMVCLRRKTLTEFELSAARKLQSWNTSNFKLPSCPLSLSGTPVLKLCSRASSEATDALPLSCSHPLVTRSSRPLNTAGNSQR